MRLPPSWHRRHTASPYAQPFVLPGSSPSAPPAFVAILLQGNPMQLPSSPCSPRWGSGWAPGHEKWGVSADGATLQVAEPDLLKACAGADVLLFVVPHQFIGKVCEQLKGHVKKDAIGMSLIKV